jgi:phosphoglycolate phosphatase
MIQKPEAIILDWDNTLCNTAPIIDYCLQEVCIVSGKGKEFIKEIKKFNGVSLKDFFPILFGHKWQEFGDLYLSLYNKNCESMLELLPNSKKILDFFYNKKIPLFILSNKTAPTLREEISQFSLDKYFSAIVGSGDGKFDKPHFQAVEFCLKDTNLSPQKNNIWLIGDTEIDLECAIESKCQPILVNQNPSEKSLKIIKNNKEIKYFLDINQILDWYNKTH